MDNKGTVCKSSERIYTIYNAMMSRCYNPNVPHYFRYGGRGISVCDEWRNNYYSFREWAYESGYDENAPRGKCTIDRIDDDGNYCPENCRWVDMKVQNNNQHPAYTFMPRPSNSKHKRKLLWTIDGETKSAIEWCEEYGVTMQFATYRVKKKGMTPKEALTTPKANQGRGRTWDVTGIPEKRSHKKRKQPATDQSTRVAPYGRVSNETQEDITTNNS